MTDNEYDADYQREFHAVRPIMEKHFSTLEPEKIPNLVHMFLAARSSALYEAWDYDAQQKLLTKLRKHLRAAARDLSKIEAAVVGEVQVNLTLPLEVLNGTVNRKTCSEDVFDRALSLSDSNIAGSVLVGLRKFEEHIDKAILYTQNELPTGIRRRNRNIKAWRMVECTVEVCRSYPGIIDVPRKLDGAGPLYRLLEDLFAHHNINANINRAFKSWFDHMDSNRESLFLLPID